MSAAVELPHPATWPPGLTEHHTAHSGRYAEVAALYGEGDGRRGHPVWCRISRRGDVVPISLAWPTPTGDFQGAEPLARQAVQLRTRRVGPDHQNAAADLAGRRGLLAEHNLDEARKYRQAFDIYLRVFGDER